MLKRVHRAAESGLTLIEVTIAVAIAAMVAAIAIGAVSSLTNASLHSTAIELTGGIKFSYDRAIMEHRTERLAIDMDRGIWWIDYTQEPYALSQVKLEGKEGDKLDDSGDKAEPSVPGVAGKPGKPGKKIKRIASKASKAKAPEQDRTSFFGDPDKPKKDEVKLALEGGKAMDFQADTEVGGPKKFPSPVRVSKVWTGHQEEPFVGGTAYIHFFSGGWTEPAQIELTDGSEFVSMKVYPLTGRVRTYNKQLEVPKSDHEDGKVDEAGDTN